MKYVMIAECARTYPVAHLCCSSNSSSLLHLAADSSAINAFCIDTPRTCHNFILEKLSMAIASKTGTLILTTKGLQSLEDLQVGDQVHTHMGRWRAIKQIVKRSSIQLRRIRTDGGLIITTTDDQPFLTRFKSYHWDNSLRQDVRQFTDPTWVNAKDLTINHFVGQILPDESQNEYTLDLWTDI